MDVDTVTDRGIGVMSFHYPEGKMRHLYPD